MTTKILINNEEVEITLTPEQVKAITAQQKAKQWEPQDGDFYVTARGTTATCIPSVSECRNFGTEYQTSKLGKKARDIMRFHNRLLAWVIENDDGFIVDWEDINQEKYYVFYDYDLKYYEHCFETTDKMLSTVYMSKQNAKKLYKLLNSGEVVL